MSKLILCTGAYAEKPYYWEKVGKNIYSIEELCYLVIHNAFLIDSDSFDEEMINWISDECKLKKLAEELRSMLAKKCSPASVAGTLLEYVRYGTDEEIAKAQEIIKENSSLDEFQKKMARADYLLKSGSYKQALNEYDAVLTGDVNIDKMTRAKIEHNKGVIYAGFFQFKKAAEMFALAFQDGNSEESYLEYLTALRLYMPESEYINYLSENTIPNEVALKLEKRINEAEEMYASSDDSKMIKELSDIRNNSNISEYNNKIADIAGNLKQEYRGMVRQRSKKRG
ncbi:MAG: hypothetical protein K6B41_07865 [Butyrivibrio sp.]|nr:hypothetical protein [Butyrivibrio sp.]